jgi:hypothetical protein
LENVTHNYSLSPGDMGEGAEDAGLTISSAIRDHAGVVTIKLTGTVKGEYTLKAEGTGPGSITYEEGYKFRGEDYWGIHTPPKYTGAAATAAPAPGSYAVVRIKGLYNDDPDQRVMALKQTNQAYRIYQYDQTYQIDGTGGTLLASPSTGPKTRPNNNEPILWVPAASDTKDAPIEWVLGTLRVRDSTSTLSLPIWDGGTEAGLSPYTPRTAKLEIAEYDNYADGSTPKAGGYKATFIIDYSDVEFEEPVTTPPGAG